MNGFDLINRKRNVLVFIIILLFSIIVSFGVVFNYYLLILCLLPVIVFIYIIQPEFGIIFSFLSILNLIPFIDFYKSGIPGVFKLRDIPFLLAFLPLLKVIFIKKNNLKYAIRSPFLKWVFIFELWVFLVMLMTKLQFNVSWNLIIRSARDYYHYLLLIPFLYVFLDVKRRIRILKYLMFYISICAIAYIVQSLTAVNFDWLLHSRTVPTEYFNRVYSRIVSASPIFLGLAIGKYVFKKSSNLKIFLSIVLFFLVCALSYTRALYFGLFVSFLLSYILTLKLDLRFSSKHLTLFFGIFMTLAVVGTFISQSPDWILNAFADRIAQGIKDIKYREGTWGYRLTIMAPFLDVVRRNPWYGIGFLHKETGLLAFLPYGESGNADIGIINLLAKLGIPGAILWIGLIYMVAKRIRYIFIPHFPHKVYIFGGFFFLLTAIFSSLTLLWFVSFFGIINVVFAIALIEAHIIEYEFIKEKIILDY